MIYDIVSKIFPDYNPSYIIQNFLGCVALMVGIFALMLMANPPKSKE